LLVHCLGEHGLITMIDQFRWEDGRPQKRGVPTGDDGPHPEPRLPPEALVYFFKELGFPVNRIGFEAGPLSQRLHTGLTQAGFETVLLETRQVKAALSAPTTDRSVSSAA
jgi:hypothetical protein